MKEGIMNHVADHKMCMSGVYVCKYVRKTAHTVLDIQ